MRDESHASPDYWYRQSGLSREAYTLFTSALNEHTEQLLKWAETLPTTYPNQQALVEHITALRALLPPIEE